MKLQRKAITEDFKDFAEVERILKMRYRADELFSADLLLKIGNSGNHQFIAWYKEGLLAAVTLIGVGEYALYSNYIAISDRLDAKDAADCEESVLRKIYTDNSDKILYLGDKKLPASIEQYRFPKWKRVLGAEFLAEVNKVRALIFKSLPCPKCKGKGSVKTWYTLGISKDVCPLCHGTGREIPVGE